jgi:ABC-type multidrug transport system fused ATPase/permease subunit
MRFLPVQVRSLIDPANNRMTLPSSRASPARNNANAQSLTLTQIWERVRTIHQQMSRPRRRQLYGVLALMLFNAGAELCTIGAVLPLLILISRPQALRHHAWVSSILQALARDSQASFLIIATAIFIAFAMITGVLRFQLTRITFTFGYDFAHELTLEIQRRLLLQPYIFHVQRNTSTLVSALDKANIFVFEVLLPLMQALIGGFIAVFIITALVAVDPVIASVAALTFSTIYLAISAFTRRSLAANSDVISKSLDERLKIVQESLGSIRDVIIDGSQLRYFRQFDRENSKLGRARASNAIAAAAPRYLIESLGIMAIVAIAVIASQRKGGFAAALPALGTIALGAQRLLPLIQQVYRGWSTAFGHSSVIGQMVELLTLPIEEPVDGACAEPLSFKGKISVEKLGFAYPGRRSATLEEINFEVPAGCSLGIVGATGSGKSTLADLLMGLLEAGEGEIRIDGTALTKNNCGRWRRQVAHVPQSIYLADTTVARNIAIGLPHAPRNYDRIIDAAKQAQLHDFIMTLPAQYETHVGERGTRLSGGQRQRLGIARAIYKDTSVLILDEATNALDEPTEKAVVEALQDLCRNGRTLIIAAHRLSTVYQCDLVARLEHGRLTGFGPGSEILGRG